MNPLENSRVYALWSEFETFLREYKSTPLAWASNLFATICWITSSTLPEPNLKIAALSLHIVPLLGYYKLKSPFGIDFSYTPTVMNNGERRPDKTSEDNDEAIVEGGRSVLHCHFKISRARDSFEIEFDTPEEVHVELRDIPLTEHQYRPDIPVLTCTDVSEYKFECIVDVFVHDKNGGRSDYTLRVTDGESDRPLKQIDLISC